MKNIILILFIMIPCVLFGQIEFTTVPINKQLVGRNIDITSPLYNTGEVKIQGNVDNTNTLYDYDFIIVQVYRDNILDTALSDYQGLGYNNNSAQFNFSINIPAELNNYKFEVYGRTGGNGSPEFDINIPVNWTLERTIEEVVAGDAYIIYGQSNAEAEIRTDSPFTGESSNDNQSEFIRAYGSSFVTFINNSDFDNKFFANDKWYRAEGDGPLLNGPPPKSALLGVNGFVGQWGLKLARLIMDETGIPVAIFNGARGGQRISALAKLNNNPLSGLYAPYQQLLYRIDKTGLRNNIRAVFWSQGEADGFYKTSLLDYKNTFLDIKSDMMGDFPYIEKTYIFQSKNSTGSPCSFVITEDINVIKEAQRQLANENLDIHIMQTAALLSPDNCHFKFVDGFEEFANRIYNLVDRDIYGGTGYTQDIETPMITSAYLSNSTTLVVETDAINLSMISAPGLSEFQLKDSNGDIILNPFVSISISGNTFSLILNAFPGSNPTISYFASNFDPGNFIVNTEGIELICFNDYPIQVPTTWDGSTWSFGAPDSTKDAIIAGTYLASQGNIESNNLIIDGNLNFNNNTTNSVIVHGDLTININGSFIIGDQESLVMKDNAAAISGDITKIEISTYRNDPHDITYWSSPVENVTIENVFSDVTSSRIFLFDQSQSSAIDPDDDLDYWNIWQPIIAGQMIPGQGYAAEGPTGTTGRHEILNGFTGPPNNGLIHYTLKGHFEDSITDNDFNLIGNPYPCAININSFFDANPNIDGTAYLWTHNTAINAGGDFTSDDYATYNYTGGATTSPGSGSIIPDYNFGSGQGFFVRAISPGGNVTFDNSMRIKDANNQFFKTNISNKKLVEKDRIWLNLATDQGGFSQILIGFIDKATAGVDKGYDASRLDGGNPLSFYSQIDSNKYVIQGLSSFTNDQKVDLGFDIRIAPRNFTISIDKMEGQLKTSEVYLIDNLLNITHDLKNSDYQFEQTIIGEYFDRFTLQFLSTTLNVDKIVNDYDNFIISNSSSGLNIRAGKVVSDIKIYDVLGRLIMHNKPGKQNFTLGDIDLKDGTILIVKATLTNGVKINKKTIKY